MPKVMCEGGPSNGKIEDPPQNILDKLAGVEGRSCFSLAGGELYYATKTVYNEGEDELPIFRYDPPGRPPGVPRGGPGGAPV